MEIAFFIFALLAGAAYVAILVVGLQRNKSWAHEIVLTISLMEPSRGYMDYAHLRHRDKKHGAQTGLDRGEAANSDQPADQLAA